MKGRTPKTGYDREQFGGDWLTVAGCDMRNRILRPGPSPRDVHTETGGRGSYANCDAVTAAGQAPLVRGTRAYADNRNLDRDDDGAACE